MSEPRRAVWQGLKPHLHLSLQVLIPTSFPCNFTAVPPHPMAKKLMTVQSNPHLGRRKPLALTEHRGKQAVKHNCTSASGAAPMQPQCCSTRPSPWQATPAPATFNWHQSSSGRRESRREGIMGQGEEFPGVSWGNTVRSDST